MTRAYSSRMLERVRAPPPLGAGRQVISKQRLAARAVDQDVARLDHRHRFLRRYTAAIRCTAFGPRVSISSLRAARWS